MNIKGVFQIWMKDGDYHEVALKECHAWTREGCKTCPDFAAEHADISTGGIGEFNDWTLTIVRTDLGREIIDRMIADGTIIARPAHERREGDEAAAHAVDREPPALAASADRAPAIGVPAEEEGRRGHADRYRRSGSGRRRVASGRAAAPAQADVVASGRHRRSGSADVASPPAEATAPPPAAPDQPA